MQKEIAGVSSDAMDLLMIYHWPGNIRELENTVKRAVVICKGNKIIVENLPQQIICAEKQEHEVPDKLVEAIEPLLDKLFENIIITSKEKPELEVMAIIEKGMIERAIRLTAGNKVQAASLLGINRNTLRNKMERYGIKESA